MTVCAVDFMKSSCAVVPVFEMLFLMLLLICDLVVYYILLAT